MVFKSAQDPSYKKEKNIKFKPAPQHLTSPPTLAPGEPGVLLDLFSEP